MPRTAAATSRRAGGSRPGRGARTGPAKAAPKLVGAEAPRLFTKPLRRLTPHTSAGFECIEFAEFVLGADLLPWHRWWLKHALELDRNGDGFRFRVIVTLVARQNGKTFLMIIVALWMLYTGRARLILGSAQSLDTAREAWQGAVERAEGDVELAAEIDSVRLTNGEQTLKLINGARYKITASTRSAGRGLSVDLLLLDELREHRDWAAWSALSKTTNARPFALTLGFSNAGDDQSVVLNALRGRALSETDDTLAIFEWSGADGCALDDRDALAQANPGVGHIITERALLSALATDPPNVFRTECLCQKVDQLDGAIDLAAWKASRDATGTMDDLRERIVACVDVSPDLGHVALAVAAEMPDGRYRIEVVAAWKSTEDARRDLAELLGRVKPVALAWFPSGPAAAIAPDLQTDPGDSNKRTHESVKITGQEVLDACQGFAELVTARRIVQPGDPLLDAHVAGAHKLKVGDGWRFVRRGAGHVNAAYAAAGAVHVLRTMPVEKPLPRPMVV